MGVGVDLELLKVGIDNLLPTVRALYKDVRHEIKSSSPVNSR